MIPVVPWERTLRYAAVILGCVFMAACGGSPPEILFADAQLFVFRDLEAGTTEESLRLYVAVNDGDGIEDLGMVTVVHDEGEVYWQAGPEEWVTIEQDGDSWIGLPDLRPVAGFFQRGRYRVIVEDKALQEVESTFGITVPIPVMDELTFPELREGSEGVQVVSEGAVVIRVYNRTGVLVLSREVSPGLLGIDFLRELPNEPGLAAYLSTPPGPAVRTMVGPFDIER